MLKKDEIFESFEHIESDKLDNVDDVMEELIILERIKIGLEQADRGELIPIEQVIEELKRW